MEQVAHHLQKGGVVAFPTDTVWGLAASPVSRAGFEALYRLKGRSCEKALILLGASLPSLLPFMAWKPAEFEELAFRFWPGPLTLLVPAHPSALTARDGVIGVRIPRHPCALDLLARTGPLAVTSANLAGAPPLSSATEIRASFPSSLLVIDGDPAPQGLPSTIVSLYPECRLVRSGALLAADLGEKFC